MLLYSVYKVVGQKVLLYCSDFTMDVSLFLVPLLCTAVVFASFCDSALVPQAKLHAIMPSKIIMTNSADDIQEQITGVGGGGSGSNGGGGGGGSGNSWSYGGDGAGAVKVEVGEAEEQAVEVVVVVVGAVEIEVVVVVVAVIEVVGEATETGVVVVAAEIIGVVEEEITTIYVGGNVSVTVVVQAVMVVEEVEEVMVVEPGVDKMEKVDFTGTGQATARAIIGSASTQCALHMDGVEGCGCSARCTARDPASMIVIGTVEHIADSDGFSVIS